MTPPRLKVVGEDKSTAGETRREDGQLADEVSAKADAAGSPVHGLIESISTLPAALDRRAHLRVLEAVLFAAKEPLDAARLATYLPEGEDIVALIAELKQCYQGRGVGLVEVAGKWSFRTASDLSHLL